MREIDSGPVHGAGLSQSSTIRNWCIPAQRYTERISTGLYATKYKILTGMVTDDGGSPGRCHRAGRPRWCHRGPRRPRSLRRSKSDLYGGTAALVMDIKALIRTDKPAQPDPARGKPDCTASCGPDRDPIAVPGL